MNPFGTAMTVELAGRRWRIGAQGHDLSIALAFNEAQPSFFGARAAAGNALVAGSFVGDVRQGGSCNCATYTLTPHCNGTHTECVGHVTREPVSVRDAALEHLSPALLISVRPQLVPARARCAENAQRPSTEHDRHSYERPAERLITREVLMAAVAPHELTHYPALIVRSLPNDDSKRTRNYDSGEPAPCFTAEAMHWIVQQGVRTLVVDLPSLDRADDANLTTHRIFWGLPEGASSVALAARPYATVTELAYVPNTVADGHYLLNLQIAPFTADAAPSRPILLPLQPT